MIISVSCETCGLLRAVKPADVCLSKDQKKSCLKESAGNLLKS